MLKLTNVKKNYPGFSLSCSLEVLPGHVTGLVGSNGAGKSTTYKIILGLIRRESGTAEVFGKDAASLTADDRRNIGTVMAESGFSGYLKVRDVEKMLQAFYPAFDSAFFLQKCRDSGIPLDKQIKDFSTGMKARLKVIAAVSHNARLLILDEPTAGLDVVARDETLDILRDYMAQDENRAILISSHISGDLESICDDIYMIDSGSIVFHEDTDRLLSDYAILKTDREGYAKLAPQHILRRKEEPYGYSLLTDSKQFYCENYPWLAVENGSVDELILMMRKGEKI